MDKGLSELQRAILDALKGFPSVTLAQMGRPGFHHIGDWARPKDILAALGREPTNANRAVISRALARLVDRNLVAMARGQLRSQGNGARFALRAA
jgi:hypothetical protein